MIQGLDTERFLAMLEQISATDTPLYIHRSPSNQYGLFLSKDDQQSQGEIYSRLTYRDITHLFLTFMDPLRRIKDGTALAMRVWAAMRQKKERQAERLGWIASLIEGVWDRMYNLFHHHTWINSLELSGNTLRALEEAPAHQQVIEDSPETEETVLQRDEKPSFQIRQPSGKWNEKSFNTYKSTPFAMRDFAKRNLFQTVEIVEPSRGQPALKDFVSFLQDLVDSDTFALEGSVAEAIVDLCRFGNKEAQSQLVVWLKKQDTFEPELCKRLLKTLNGRYDARAVEPFALISLLDHYWDNGWNEHEGFSLQDETVKTAMHILLIEVPNNNRVTALVEKFCKHPDFLDETFLEWWKIFDCKEDDHQTSLEYPVREIMSTSKPHLVPQKKAIARALSMPAPIQRRDSLPVNRIVRPDDRPENNISRRGRTKAKSEALQAYKRSDSTPSQLTMVFRDIKYTEQPSQPSPEREVTSIADLIEFVTGNVEIDCSNPDCQRVIRDVLTYETDALKESAIEMACKHKSFNQEMLILCLEYYLKENEKLTFGKLMGLETLLSAYQKNKWHRGGELSPNDPRVAGAIAILVRLKPNELTTEKLVRAFKPYCSSATLEGFRDILVMKNRQRPAGTPEIVYRLHDVLA